MKLTKAQRANLVAAMTHMERAKKALALVRSGWSAEDDGSTEYDMLSYDVEPNLWRAADALKDVIDANQQVQDGGNGS